MRACPQTLVPFPPSAAAPTATTTIPATTTATAATAAFLTRARFVDGQVAIAHRVAIELADGLRCVVCGSHGHKSKTFGATCFAVCDDRHVSHCPCLAEQFT